MQISYSHVTIPSPQLAPSCVGMPVRPYSPLHSVCTRYAPDPTRTQYPHQQRPRSPPRGYLLTLSVGKVGTRRLGVADRSRSRRGEFRQLDGFRQLRRVSSIARSLHPSRTPDGGLPAIPTASDRPWHLHRDVSLVTETCLVCSYPRGTLQCGCMRATGR